MRTSSSLMLTSLDIGHLLRDSLSHPGPSHHLEVSSSEALHPLEGKSAGFKSPVTVARYCKTTGNGVQQVGSSE